MLLGKIALDSSHTLSVRYLDIALEQLFVTPLYTNVFYHDSDLIHSDLRQSVLHVAATPNAVALKTTYLMPDGDAAGKLQAEVALGKVLLTPRLDRVFTGWYHGGSRLLGGVIRFIAANLAATLGAMVFTAPLIAWYFNIFVVVAPLAGLLARAVVVIDKAGRVVYTELVPEITEEPDYDKAVEAVKAN